VVCGDLAAASPEDGAGDSESSTLAAENLAAEAPAGFQLRSVAELLPAPLHEPAGFDLRRQATSFAVALESACPRLGWRANLLPAERRKSDSRWMYAPTAALAVAVVLLAVAFAMRPLIQDRKYVAALDAESARLEQIVRNVEQTEQQSGNVRRRLARLHTLRQRPKLTCASCASFRNSSPTTSGFTISRSTTTARN
jgi:hypothetical protein